MQKSFFGDFFRHNLRIFYIFDFTRALIFYGSVWVAFERQFISAGELVFIEGIIIGSQLLLELPTGAFADLVGRKTSVSLGFFVSSLGLIVFGFSTSFWSFFVYALLIGLGEAFISGAREALLYDTLKESQKEDAFDSVSAKLSFIFQTTFSVATILGGYFGIIDIRLPIWFYAAALMVTAIISLMFVEPHIDSVKFTYHGYIQQIRNGFSEITKNSYIRKVSLFYILVGSVSWVCMLVFNYTVLTDFQFTAAQMGLILGFSRFSNSIILLRLVKVNKIFTKSLLYILFPILLIVSLLPGIWLTKVIVIPFVMGSMLASTARWVILAKYNNKEFDSKNRATAISTLSMFIGILYVIFTWGSGPIIEWWGNSTIMFTVFGVFSLLFILPLGIHLAKIKK